MCADLLASGGCDGAIRLWALAPLGSRPEQIAEAEPSADEADALLSGLPDPFRARATDAFVFGNALGEEYATRRLKMARCDEIH